jgi:hypothetical protein
MSGGAGQAASTIDDRHVCRSCEIRIEKVTTLSDPESGMGRYLSYGNLTRIDRDSRGRYWVVDDGSPTTVFVFAVNGKLIKRIGRAGSGPGEFRNLTTAIVGRGDTVHVFDRGLYRRSEISPTTLEVVRQVSVSDVPMNVVLLANGNFVGTVSQAHRVGHPFVELDRHGGLVRAFGGDGKPRPSAMQNRLSRRVLTDGQGGFYAHPRSNYQLEHWNAAGRLTGRWSRDAKWFAPREPGDNAVGAASITAAWVNDGGFIFVVSWVRQEGWEKGMGQIRGEGGRMTYGVVDWDRVFDSIVEVIDPRTSRVVATTRHDIAFAWVAGNGQAYAKADDDESVDVYRFTFLRR